MANSQPFPRAGCCCEKFLGYDEATGQTVGRVAPHHCCPIHGGRDVRPTAR